MSITRLNAWIRDLADPLAVDLKAAIGARLTALEEIGLGYLSLDRPVGTLSGGEAQRCKIAKYINSSLADVLYILDEPSVGLHRRAQRGPAQPRHRADEALGPAPARRRQHRPPRGAPPGDDQDCRPRRRSGPRPRHRRRPHRLRGLLRRPPPLRHGHRLDARRPHAVQGAPEMAGTTSFPARPGISSTSKTPPCTTSRAFPSTCPWAFSASSPASRAPGRAP